MFKCTCFTHRAEASPMSQCYFSQSDNIQKALLKKTKKTTIIEMQTFNMLMSLTKYFLNTIWHRWNSQYSVPRNHEVHQL